MRFTQKKIQIYFRRAYLLGHYPSLIKIIFSKKKKLIYYGFLGDRNFGDELVFLATKKLFNDCVLIPYLRHMPVLTKAYCKLFPDSVDGVIIGGGTIIRGFSSDKAYFKKLSRKNKPLFFHGTGTDEHLMDKTFWPSFINNNTYGGLRGPQSQMSLKKNGFNFKQLGDAGLYLDRGLKNSIKKKIIIINFGTHKLIEELLQSRKQIIQFLKSESVAEYKIVYLPLHSKDLTLGLALKTEIENLEVLQLAHSYEETLDLIKEAEFCIGERLHFTVMSVMANTPFISMNYDNKHEDFLESVALKSYGFPPNTINVKLIDTLFKARQTAINWTEINGIIDDFKSEQEVEKAKFLRS